MRGSIELFDDVLATPFHTSSDTCKWKEHQDTSEEIHVTFGLSPRSMTTSKLRFFWHHVPTNGTKTAKDTSPEKPESRFVECKIHPNIGQIVSKLPDENSTSESSSRGKASGLFANVSESCNEEHTFANGFEKSAECDPPVITGSQSLNVVLD